MTDGIALFISTAAGSAGGMEVSNNGSRVKVSLPNAIDIGLNRKLRTHSIDFWYSFPNISTSRNNNKFAFTYDTEDFLITFNDGLYDLDAINETIQDHLLNNQLPTNLIFLNADEATNLITLQITTSRAFLINFDLTNNILAHDYLGFRGSFTTSVNANHDSIDIARLNVVNSVYVFTDIVNSGTFNNISGSNCIAVIPLTESPNSLVSYRPYFPFDARINTTSISTFSIWLTDEALRPLDMFGETWSAHFSIV